MHCPVIIHAFAHAMLYTVAPPCKGGWNRTKLRNSFGIEGTMASDAILHLFCAPCALAQEARHLRSEPYVGKHVLKMPMWRRACLGCLPSKGMDEALFEACAHWLHQTSDRHHTPQLPAAATVCRRRRREDYYRRVSLEPAGCPCARAEPRSRRGERRTAARRARLTRGG